MRSILRNEKGTALVATLFFITALSLTATVIVWVTGSERRVSQNDYAHVRSFYSSDAGSEGAINWMRLQDMPPSVVDVSGGEQFVKKDSTYTALESDHLFRFDVMHKLAGGQPSIKHRPGWDNSWVDFEYIIDSFGTSSSKSEAEIEVQAARLFRLDYTY